MFQEKLFNILNRWPHASYISYKLIVRNEQYQEVLNYNNIIDKTRMLNS